MPLIRILVKGSPMEAVEACRKRGLEADVFWNTDPMKKLPDVAIVDLPGSEEVWDKVVKWFCEEGTAPFPVGTCLFYAIVTED